jgi:hypothetical protein
VLTLQPRNSIAMVGHSEALLALNQAHKAADMALSALMVEAAKAEEEAEAEASGEAAAAIEANSKAIMGKVNRKKTEKINPHQPNPHTVTTPTPIHMSIRPSPVRQRHTWSSATKKQQRPASRRRCSSSQATNASNETSPHSTTAVMVLVLVVMMKTKTKKRE